jgi:hypothetical protein
VDKRRSGSETRQRTERLNLRLLPSEQRALRVLAEGRKRRLPDEAMCPPELDECPSEGRNRFVDRRSVFGIAERVIETPYDPFSATATELPKSQVSRSRDNSAGGRW